MGKKIAKLPCYPQVTVSAQSNYIQSNNINDVTSNGEIRIRQWWTQMGKNSAKVWYDMPAY
jgi:hypothetical protein